MPKSNKKTRKVKVHKIVQIIQSDPEHIFALTDKGALVEYNIEHKAWHFLWMPPELSQLPNTKK